jgi:hypothetical protein
MLPFPPIRDTSGHSPDSAFFFSERIVLALVHFFELPLGACRKSPMIGIFAARASAAVHSGCTGAVKWEQFLAMRSAKA